MNIVEQAPTLHPWAHCGRCGEGINGGVFTKDHAIICALCANEHITERERNRLRFARWLYKRGIMTDGEEPR